MRPTATLLPDGKRLHLQHGPIDLIIGADGDRARAFTAASERFETILDDLVAELPFLRCEVLVGAPPPQGKVAKRMDHAVRPYCSNTFVTRMAAVAGSVADDVLQVMCESACLERAFVNNGGDIALHLSAGTRFTMAMARHDGRDLGRIEIKDTDPVRGIATSGRHGRSFSLGIADSVTVLAGNAAQADVAATLIANRIDLPDHPAIVRRSATEVEDDSDLGDLPVVTHCGALSLNDIDRALDAGASCADTYVQRNLIVAAALFLNDHSRATQQHNFQNIQRMPEYA
jgi:ApbE superfamily uncharacterized protein (UPF0280 family)